ncbi:MAG: zf-HC2 domain-containing protein [Elusimicrobia bacterium]|nr:zf-HC2 domain-containing protein [Elusimicrobiota bacterium]
MAHDVSAEDLSAFLDGELPAERKAQVAEHLRACASCGRELERFKKASAAFRQHGKRALPARLLDKIRDRLRPVARRSEPMDSLVYVFALTVVVGVVLVTGVALKRFMPGLFSSIQQMISGAATSLGQGK